MAEPGAHICAKAGCARPASLGFRYPGPRSEVPDRFRGYIWACSEHVDGAEARIAAMVAEVSGGLGSMQKMHTAPDGQGRLI